VGWTGCGASRGRFRVKALRSMAGHKNPEYSSDEEASPGLWYRDIELVGVARKGYHTAQRLVARKGRRR
jgi:hypothetical protein